MDSQQQRIAKLILTNPTLWSEINLLVREGAELIAPYVDEASTAELMDALRAEDFERAERIRRRVLPPEIHARATELSNRMVALVAENDPDLAACILATTMPVGVA